MNQGTLDGSHSRCVQLSVSSPSDAGSAFNRANGVEICLVAVPGGASVAKFTAETLGGGGWPARQVEAVLAWADRTDALKGIDWFGVLGWLVLVGCVSFSSPSRYAMADAWDPRFTGWGSGARYR